MASLPTFGCLPRPFPHKPGRLPLSGSVSAERELPLELQLSLPEWGACLRCIFPAEGPDAATVAQTAVSEAC